MLGQNPDRDREIEKVQTLIRNVRARRIPSIRYNLTISAPPQRPRLGPGGASFTVCTLDDVTPAQQDDPARKGRADTFWERITYFLDRVIPVANEHKVDVRGCSPPRPAHAPGFQGVDSVLGHVEGLKKFVGIRESPYHGSLLPGTIASMLPDPPARSSTSSAGSAPARRSSTSTSATSTAPATPSRSASPTPATSTSSRP
jgi:mannonate dehydratase